MSRAAVRAAQAAAVFVVFASGCSAPAALVDNLTVECRLDPAAPVVGETTGVILTLTQPDGSPVVDASITLEGHMAHPGMAPVIAPLEARGAGRYRATATLTMAGEWQFVVNGRLADGRLVRQRVADIVATMRE